MKRLSILILFLAACATAPRAPIAQPAAQSAQPIHVIVVATTDRHGWYDSHHESRTAPPYGGLPLMGGYLQNLRASHEGRVIVVDSGDLFQGTLESNLFEGEPVIKGYNAPGYNAASGGNPALDIGS